MQLRHLCPRVFAALVSAFAMCLLFGGAAAANDTITVDGEEIPRLAVPAVNIGDQAAVDAFFSVFLADPVTDFRTVEAAEASVGLALPKPRRLGKIAYVRPGIGNIMFSPAWIYLLAQHYKTVVLMYSNMTDPEPGATAVRRVAELEGVPIPASIRNKVKIFAIGSPNLNLISSLQQSDTTLEQLEILRSSPMLDDKVLNDGVPAWMFAHSQGMIDTILTDERLRAAGLVPFERIIGVAGAVKGGRLIESAIGPLLIDGAEAVGGEQGRVAFELVGKTATVDVLADVLGIGGPDFAKEFNLDIELIKRTFAGFGGVLDSSAPQGNARLAFLGLTDIPDGDGLVKPNDGVEDFDSTTLAQNNLIFEQVDHILIIENPALLRAMLDVIVDALEME
jgi:hypothetical protein